MLIKLNDLFLKKPIAHRGLHKDYHDENSFSAFKEAIKQGLPFEIDIHLLKDGEIAVVHDSNLLRVTGHDVIVETLSSSDLINFPLLNGEKIPLLSELFSLNNGQVPMLIELKYENKFTPHLCNALLNALQKYGHDDMVALQSFEMKAVRYLKKKQNKYPVGLLSSSGFFKYSKLKTYIQKNLITFKYLHADFISYHVFSLPNKWVSKYHQKGYPLLVWTIHDENCLIKAKEVNADNIIFENIDGNIFHR